MCADGTDAIIGSTQLVVDGAILTIDRQGSVCCYDDLAESWLEARGLIDTTGPGRRLIDTLVQRLWAWFDCCCADRRLLMLDGSTWPCAGLVVRTAGAPELLQLQLWSHSADAGPVHALWRRILNDILENHSDASILSAA